MKVGNRKCGECWAGVGPNTIDRCLVDRLRAINEIEGVETFQSCCGHGNGPYLISCVCDDFQAAGRLDATLSHDELLTVEKNYMGDGVTFTIRQRKIIF